MFPMFCLFVFVFRWAEVVERWEWFEGFQGFFGFKVLVQRLQPFLDKRGTGLVFIAACLKTNGFHDQLRVAL